MMQASLQGPRLKVGPLNSIIPTQWVGLPAEDGTEGWRYGCKLEVGLQSGSGTAGCK